MLNRNLDREQVVFEFKADRAMWTNQSKIDKVSRKYPSPSNLVGIIQSVFNHPGIYPVVTKVELLSNPKYTSYTINGRKNLTLNDDRDKDRTQLFIQPVCNVHYRVYFQWLHINTPTMEEFEKTRNQTHTKLKHLIIDSTLPAVERLNSYKAGGKFGSLISFVPLSDIEPVDVNEDEVTSFYKFLNGKFYFGKQPFISGVWKMDEEAQEELIRLIKKDREEKPKD